VGGCGFCLRAEKNRSQKNAKMFENAAESHTSTARFVRQPACLPKRWLKKDTTVKPAKLLHTIQSLAITKNMTYSNTK